jgi:redox-sensitive bicupin YhaK (pirin superfamily)
MNIRGIKRITKGRPAIDGAGVRLVRVFGNRDVQDYDPFLLLDAFDSKNPADYIKGFPWHPHRGIETITYLIEGELEHGDSLGNKGVILNGECQWMTAGSGIIHQEMPQPSSGMLGAQIWLNLPQKDKMTAPKYGDIKEQDVPVVETDEARVRIVSGTYHDTDGAFKAEYVPTTYLDVTVFGHKQWWLDVPEKDTVFLYIISGELEIDHQVIPHKTAVLLSEGDTVQVTTNKDSARFLLLHAAPLNEPIAWGGPIVMNTKEELRIAFDDLDKGTFIKKNVRT